MNQIKLGSGRKVKQDYQYVRQVTDHLKSIEKEGTNKSMVNYPPVNSKSEADMWPHQCRYYKSCNEIVQNPTNNYGHFKRIHPWTDEERSFLLKCFEQAPNGKNVYILSVLYGRSEGELKTFFKQQFGNIPKWSKKNQEIAEVHLLLQSQMTTMRNSNSSKFKYQVPSLTDEETEEQLELLIDPIPSDVTVIQEQNYISQPVTTTPPHPMGSPDFYKNLVDTLFAKHEAWLERENHLKSKIIENEERIAELTAKLEESLTTLKDLEQNQPDEESVADYNEQVTKIFQGF